MTRSPLYRTSFQILIEPTTSGSQLGASAEADALLKSTVDVINYNTLTQVFASPELLAPVVQALQGAYPDLTPASLSENLTINQPKDTGILEISYVAKDPEKAQVVSEQLASAYLSYGNYLRKSSVQQGITFVDEQLPELQNRVNQLQAKLKTFRQRYSLIDPESRGSQLSEQLNQIEEQQQETQSQLAEARASYKALGRQVGHQPDAAIATSALSESPRYQSLLNHLQEVETAIAADAVRFQPNSPQMQALVEKRQHLKPLLNQEAQKILGSKPQAGNTGNIAGVKVDLNRQLVTTANQVQALQARSRALNQAEDRFKKDFTIVPSVLGQYTELQRQLQLSTESLNRFWATREALQVEAAQKAKPWELISRADLPKIPISPNIPRNLSLGLLGSLFLGVGAAFLAEKLDDVFHAAADLQQKVKVPLLGIIPFHNKLQKKLSVAASLSQAAIRVLPPVRGVLNPQSNSLRTGYQAAQFTEAFRSLHTNIRLLGTGTPIRSLVISSSVPSDGKSTVSYNLALAAAAMGQRVLIVDADFRRPQIHSEADLPNLRGLSNAVASNLDIDSLIQQSSQEENLFVISSGPIPADPTRLLSSAKMQQLMEQFQSSFDLVIYDTPPALNFAEGLLLAQHTDGCILVVGLGHTERPALAETLHYLQTASIPILGVVANCLKPTVTNASNYSKYYKQYYSQSQTALETETS